MRTKSYSKRFVKGGAIVFIALIVSSVMGLLLRIFLSRSLSVADYGLFYAVFALVSVFGSFRDFGIGQAVIRAIPKYAIQKDFRMIKSSMTVLMIIQISFSLVVAIVLIALSDQIAMTVFETMQASIMIKLLSGWFLFQAIFYTFKGTFRALQDVVPFSILGFSEIFFPFLFALLFISVLGSSVVNVALAYLVGLGVTIFITLSIFLKKHTNIIKAKLNISRGLLKGLFTFALPVLISGFASMTIGYMSTLMLTVFRSLSEVGLYQVAFPASNLILYFPSAIGVMLFPMVAELWARKKHDLVGKAVHTLIKFSFIFIVPIALILIAFPELVISTLFGSKYLAASMTLRILAFGAIIQTLYTILNRVILGIGRPIIITKVMGITACFVFISNLVLIPLYGIEGAAIAFVLSTLVSLTLSLKFIRKYVKFTVPSLSLIKTLTGGLLTLLIISILKIVINLSPILEVFVVMIPSLLFYGVWILLTGVLTLDDYRLLKNTIPIPKPLTWIARNFIRGIK